MARSGTPVRRAREAPVLDVVAPRADCLVESLRAFSYDLSTALADLVDNSITAGATRVWIDFFWAGESSTITVTDDGHGLPEAELVSAMRLGSKNPLAHRDPHDLGRFGLGMKTASFSQCRRLSVRSRTLGSEDATRRWDLDHISRTNDWQLLRNCDDAELCFQRLKGLKSGTAIVWQSLDRLVAGQRTDNDRSQQHFLARAQKVCAHLGMVFHERMKGKRALQLVVNDHPIEPWDPFLQGETATQTLPITRLRLRNSTVVVQPFVLPHHSKISSKRFASAQGPHGWNAHQGFFIYRAGRLLVPGDWLGFGWAKEEHFKLARIRVEIPNELDHDWAIDVTKSRAMPPAALREELRGIAEHTRTAARRVYTFRGAKLASASDADRVFLWEPVAKHDNIVYRLNREHPLVKQASAGAKDHAGFNTLMRLIEETVPAAHISIQTTESPTSLRGPFEGASEAQVLEIMKQSLRAITNSGCTRAQGMERLRALWPFELFPALLDTLTRA